MDIAALKEKLLVFFNLIREQFEYGGKKYALTASKEKESTDVLFDTFGKNWVFGTCSKYIFRYKNLKRSRDLFKIATYMYLLWLKRGFQWVPNGIDSPAIDTNLEIKSQYFSGFCDKILLALASVEEELKVNDVTTNEVFTQIQNQLKDFANKEWKAVEAYEIYSVFIFAYIEWFKSFSNMPVESQDTDTYNEEKKA